MHIKEKKLNTFVGSNSMKKIGKDGKVANFLEIKPKRNSFSM